MAKKNTKKVNPEFVVNLTNAHNMRDVYLAFAEAKINKHLTTLETEVFIFEYTRPVFYVCKECPFCKPSVKKPNIFKRFWNWITRKK